MRTNETYRQKKKSSVLQIQSPIIQIDHPRSGNVIHVTIRQPSRIKSTNTESIISHDSSHTIVTTGRKHHQQRHSSSKIDSLEQTNTIEPLTDTRNVTTDYHQRSKKNEKKKCTRRCVIGFVLIFSILLTIILIPILIVLLLKHTTTTPSTTPTLRWNTTGITVAGVSGVSGNTNYHLNAPASIALDYSNTLYISDFNNDRVQKYLRDASVGSTVAGNGVGGSSSNQLNGPYNVVLNTNGDIFVTDSKNNRIQFWSNGGNSGTTIAGNASGFAGNMSNLLFTPYDVALDSNTGTLYIADYNNHRIMSYASGASSGIIAAGGNGAGLMNTQLYAPARCYFDSLSNSLIIANFGSNTVVRWKLGDTQWTLLAGDINGLSGNTSTYFRGPRSLTLDPMGNLYVVDRNNHRIQFFLAGQSNATTIGGITGIYGNTSTLLYSPRSVALDGQLNVYVADTINNRIQKFLRY